LTQNKFSCFESLASAIGFTALDVGARGGINNDLIDIAASVDYYGFEPDIEECEKLNNFKSACGNNNQWKSLTYIPIALSADKDSFVLNIYHHRGCSSKLNPRRGISELFSRGDYYVLEDTVEVKSNRLDNLVGENRLEPPAFMKIDVQGMELEVFRGAKKSLSDSLVGIRTEVYFYNLYEGQPTFTDIDLYLRAFGFAPMIWLELHEWRRTTKLKLPKLASSAMPYSKGQLIHGDVLYLLQPEDILSGICRNNENQIKKSIRLALLAICYDLFDHAFAVFEKDDVKQYCFDIVGIDPLESLLLLSKYKSRGYRGIYGLLNRFRRHFLK
jgi:FkbM family methyltransferase